MHSTLKAYKLVLILFLVGIGWFLPTSISAQIDRIDQTLKTHKTKKKPKKKKLKRKKKEDRDGVYELGTPPPRIDFGPGSFGRKDNQPLPQRTIPKKTKEEKILTEHRKPRAKGGTAGTTYGGNKPPTYQRPPGQVYETPRPRDADLNSELSGTQSQGTLRRKKGRIQQPGLVYDAKEQAKLSKKQRDRGTQYSGNQPQPIGRHPGQVYEKPKGRDVDINTELIGTLYSGSIKGKSKGTAPGTHWQDRKVHITETGSYQGRINAVSKRKKARFYGEISQRQNQYEGNVKLERNKLKNLHPSASARMVVSAKSYEHKEKARNRSQLLNKIFRRKEQPPHIKEKDHKPRYDKGESEIWTQ